MKILELSDFSSEIQNNVEKMIIKPYKQKHICTTSRFRVLITKVDKVVLKNLICENVSFRLVNLYLLKDIELGGQNTYFFIIDDYNRILPYDASHLFCPYLIEKE